MAKTIANEQRIVAACLSILLAMGACTLLSPGRQAERPTSQQAAPTRYETKSGVSTARPTGAATQTPTPTSTPAPTPTPSAQVRMVVDKIAAPSLEGNLLGDADEQYVQVYLPPSYDTSDMEYPVVYFLPSFGSDAHGENLYFPLKKLADRMAGGKIKEMILVVPNGANTLHGSWYVNSPVTGNWEDFIVEDVVGYIDAHYRTIDRREGRGIAGHSMGGFGAINLAMRHADLFGSAYGLSPAIFGPDGLKESLMFDTQEKELAMLRNIDDLSKLPREQALKDMIHADGAAGFTLAYGTAFAGSADLKPPYFTLPYEERNGKLKRIAQEWERWQNGVGGWDEKIAAYHDDLASLDGLMIDYGSRDLVWIVSGSEYLGKALDAAGIPYQLESFDGTHGSQIEERLMEVMLPFFTDVLAKPR